MIRELFSYLRDLFNLFFQGWGTVITVLLPAAGVWFVCLLIRNRKKDRTKKFFLWIYLSASIFLLPVMLILQSVQPYKRVFSFFAVVVSILPLLLLEGMVTRLKGERSQQMGGLLVQGILFLFSVGLLLSASYNMPYADRENQIARMIGKEDAQTIQKMYYTDDYQKYVLKFYYDVCPQETTMEEADTVLVAKELFEKNYTQPQWPIMISHEMVDFSYLEKHFTIAKESDTYVLYRRKESIW